MPRIVASTLPLLLLLLLSACQPSLQQRPGIAWVDLVHGKQLAVERQKPVLVDFFYGTSCRRCDKLCVMIYEDPAIAARVEREFVPVRVDLRYPLNEEEQALSAKLGNEGECILAFLTPDARVVADEDGRPLATMDELTGDEFSSYLDKALVRLQAMGPAGK